MTFPQHFRRLGLSAYYHATLPYRRWLRARLAAQGRAPILVLFYHRIADDGSRNWTHSNRLFRHQIDWLQQHCELISLEAAQRRIRSGQNDRLAACITFDDGYAENCDHAIPLLVQREIPCTYFVSSQYVLTGGKFPDDITTGGRGLPNTLEQLRWMARCGIEIGAHTRTHPDVGRITDERQLHDEVVAAGEELQAAIGKPVRYFAFPYGMPETMSPRAVQMAHEFGYEAVCSAYGDYNFPGDDAFHIRRFHADDMLRLKHLGTVSPRRVRPAQLPIDSPENTTPELTMAASG
jgi:peptidoglycan/xylan/chitin deacetylase (PgdA/CDA1 family)